MRVTRREIIKGFESCRFECECFDTIKKEITITSIDGEIGTITLLEQGCSGNYCNVPSIFEIPIIDINNLEIIGDTILCPGQTESYTIPKYMGTIYNWNVINGTINTPSPRSNNVNVTWSSIPGIGYLIVDIFHLEKGCISRDTIKVEINPSMLQ